MICEECLNTEEINRTFSKVQGAVGTHKESISGISMQSLCNWILWGG